MKTPDSSNQFFNTLPEHAYVIGAEYSVFHINNAACQNHQINREDIIGKKCYEMYSISEPCLNCPVDDVIKTGRSVEKEMFRAQKKVWHLLKGFPVDIVDGAITKIGIIAKDITADKTAEKILVDFNYKIKNFIDRMPIGCILWDQDFKVAMWNPAAEQMFGFTEEEARGKNPYEIIVPPDMISETEPVKQNLLKGHDGSHRTGENITKDGRRIYCSWINTPIQGAEGEIIAILSMAQDITEEKMLQKEAVRTAQLVSIGQLAANIAHEINNPINGVINYAQILLNQNDLNEKQRDIITRTQKEGIRIEKIVSNLLNYARDSNNKRGYYDIKDIVVESLSILDVAFRKEGGTINFDWAGSLPKIHCNFQQIEQALINVLRNAYQALADNAPEDRRINISGGIVRLQHREYLQLIIANNGPNIPPEMLDKVLQPFVTTKPARKGTGLGLSITSSIMKEHDGQIEVRSEPGEFTEMVFLFPVTGSEKPGKN